MKDQKLKPFPFCGSEAFTQIFDPHSHILDFVPDHPGSATVECPNCPCGIIVDGSLEEAIKIWNIRTQDPMLEELANRLNNCLALLEDYQGTNADMKMIEKSSLSLRKYQQSKGGTMTTTMEEVAGWLREAANAHKLRACFSETSSGAFTHLAKGEEYLDRASQVEAMGWRPIEEAPKDGTHFIGLIGGFPYDVHCREYIEGWKETGKDGWVSSGKRVHVFCKETDESIMPCKPTHWIPLPPPPVTP